MEIIVFVLFLLFAVLGLVTHIFGLPGNFIILADAFLFSWYLDFDKVPFNIFLILIGLALLGELIEFLLGLIGAKKYKSSNRAVVGSIILGIVGAIWGAPFLFGVGSVIGAFVGAFIGAFFVELILEKNLDQALDSGWGSLIGRVGGTISKVLIGVIMIVLVVTSYVKN